MTHTTVPPRAPDFSINPFDSATVAVGGELDLAAAPALTRALKAMPTHTPVITVDLSEVSFIDSAGFSCLVTAKSRLEGEGRQLRVQVGPSSRTAATFALAGLECLLD